MPMKAHARAADSLPGACAQSRNTDRARGLCSHARQLLSIPMQPLIADLSLQPLEDYYRSHRGLLRGYLLRRGVRQEAAADVVQDTFARAVRAWPSFRGECSLSTWLHAIARHALADHLRAIGRSPEDHAFSLDDLDPADASLTAAGLARPSSGLEAGLAIRRALAEFARAHPQRAEVLHLVAVNGWTQDELGHWLGRTPHAAAQYLSQCRQLLRQSLDHQLPESDRA